MSNIGRNDPCPCGSGKKFKRCHMGREEELVLDRLENLPKDTAQKICQLPEVEYGGCRELLKRLNLTRLTGMNMGVRFIDLKSYLNLGFHPKTPRADLNRFSAGQMINPIKTLEADPDHIYVAVTPAVSPSTLIHQLAHVLDYLAGSKINPGLARPLSMELEAPQELLEHPKEFGDWLVFLANELAVQLDAEDAIVAFLHEKGRLIPGETIKSEGHDLLGSMIKSTMAFIKEHRQDIDERIKGREGYLHSQAPDGTG